MDGYDTGRPVDDSGGKEECEERSPATECDVIVEDDRMVDG